MQSRLTLSVSQYLFSRIKEIGIRSIHGVPGSDCPLTLTRKKLTPDTHLGDYNLVSLDYVAKAGLRWIGNCNELNAGMSSVHSQQDIELRLCRICGRRIRSHPWDFRPDDSRRSRGAISLERHCGGIRRVRPNCAHCGTAQSSITTAEEITASFTGRWEFHRIIENVREGGSQECADKMR